MAQLDENNLDPISKEKLEQSQTNQDIQNLRRNAEGLRAKRERLQKQQEQLLQKQESNQIASADNTNILNRWDKQLQFNLSQDKKTDYINTDYNTANQRIQLQKDYADKNVIDNYNISNEGDYLSNPGGYRGGLGDSSNAALQYLASQDDNLGSNTYVNQLKKHTQLKQQLQSNQNQYEEQLGINTLNRNNALQKLSIEQKYFDKNLETLDMEFKANLSNTLALSKLNKELNRQQYEFLVTTEDDAVFNDAWSTNAIRTIGILGDDVLDLGKWVSTGIYRKFQGKTFNDPNYQPVEFFQDTFGKVLISKQYETVLNTDFWSQMSLGKIGAGFMESAPMIVEITGALLTAGSTSELAVARLAKGISAISQAASIARASGNVQKALQLTKIAQGIATLAKGMKATIKYGGTAGIMGSNYALQHAEDRQKMYGGDFGVTSRDMGLGLVEGALDTLGFGLSTKLGASALKKYSTQAFEVGTKQGLRQAAINIGKVIGMPIIEGAIPEAITEAIQTTLEQMAIHGFEIDDMLNIIFGDDPANKKIKYQILDAMVIAGASGGALGAIGGGIKLAKDTYSDRSINKAAKVIPPKYENTANIPANATEVDMKASINNMGKEVLNKVENIAWSDTTTGKEIENQFNSLSKKYVENFTTLQKLESFDSSKKSDPRYKEAYTETKKAVEHFGLAVDTAHRAITKDLNTETTNKIRRLLDDLNNSENLQDRKKLDDIINKYYDKTQVEKDLQPQKDKTKDELAEAIKARNSSTKKSDRATANKNINKETGKRKEKKGKQKYNPILFKRAQDLAKKNPKSKFSKLFRENPDEAIEILSQSNEIKIAQLKNKQEFQNKIPQMMDILQDIDPQLRTENALKNANNKELTTFDFIPKSIQKEKVTAEQIKQFFYQTYKVTIPDENIGAIVDKINKNLLLTPTDVYKRDIKSSSLKETSETINVLSKSLQQVLQSKVNVIKDNTLFDQKKLEEDIQAHKALLNQVHFNLNEQIKYLESIEDLNEKQAFKEQLVLTAKALQEVNNQYSNLLGITQQTINMKVEDDSSKLLSSFKVAISKFKLLSSLFLNMFSNLGKVFSRQDFQELSNTLDIFAHEYMDLNDITTEIIRDYNTLPNLKEVGSSQITNLPINGQVFDNIKNYSILFDEFGINNKNMYKEIPNLIANFATDEYTETSIKNKDGKYTIPENLGINKGEILRLTLGEDYINIIDKVKKDITNLKDRREMISKLVESHLLSDTDVALNLMTLIKAGVLAHLKTLTNKSKTKDIQINGYEVYDAYNINNDSVRNFNEILAYDKNEEFVQTNGILSLALLMLTNKNNNKYIEALSGNIDAIKYVNNNLITPSIDKLNKTIEDYNSTNDIKITEDTIRTENTPLDRTTFPTISEKDVYFPKSKIKVKNTKDGLLPAMNANRLDWVQGKLSTIQYLHKMSNEFIKGSNPSVENPNKAYLVFKKLNNFTMSAFLDKFAEEEMQITANKMLPTLEDGTHLTEDSKKIADKNKHKSNAFTKAKDEITFKVNQNHKQNIYDILKDKGLIKNATETDLFSNFEIVKNHNGSTATLKDINFLKSGFRKDEEANHYSIKDNPLYYIPIYEIIKNENGVNKLNIRHFIKFKETENTKELMKELGLPVLNETYNQLGKGSRKNEDIATIEGKVKELGEFLTLIQEDNPETKGYMPLRSQAFKVMNILQPSGRVMRGGMFNPLANKLLRPFIKPLNGIGEENNSLIDEHTIQDLIDNKEENRELFKDILASTLGEAGKNLMAVPISDTESKIEYDRYFNGSTKEKPLISLDEAYDILFNPNHQEFDNLQKQLHKIALEIELGNEPYGHLNAYKLYTMMKDIKSNKLDTIYDLDDFLIEIDGTATGIAEAALHIAAMDSALSIPLGQVNAIEVDNKSLYHRLLLSNNKAKEELSKLSDGDENYNQRVLDALRTDIPYGKIMMDFYDSFKNSGLLNIQTGNPLLDYFSGIFNKPVYNAKDTLKLYKDLRDTAKKIVIPLIYGSTPNSVAEGNHPNSVQGKIKKMLTDEFVRLLEEVNDNPTTADLLIALKTFDSTNKNILRDLINLKKDNLSWNETIDNYFNNEDYIYVFKGLMQNYNFYDLIKNNLLITKDNTKINLDTLSQNQDKITNQDIKIALINAKFKKDYKASSSGILNEGLKAFDKVSQAKASAGRFKALFAVALWQKAIKDLNKIDEEKQYNKNTYINKVMKLWKDVFKNVYIVEDTTNIKVTFDKSNPSNTDMSNFAKLLSKRATDGKIFSIENGKKFELPIVQFTSMLADYSNDKFSAFTKAGNILSEYVITNIPALTEHSVEAWVLQNIIVNKKIPNVLDIYDGNILPIKYARLAAKYWNEGFERIKFNTNLFDQFNVGISLLDIYKDKIDKDNFELINDMLNALVETYDNTRMTTTTSFHNILYPGMKFNHTQNGTFTLFSITPKEAVDRVLHYRSFYLFLKEIKDKIGNKPKEGESETISNLRDNIDNLQIRLGHLLLNSKDRIKYLLEKEPTEKSIENLFDFYNKNLIGFLANNIVLVKGSFFKINNNYKNRHKNNKQVLQNIDTLARGLDKGEFTSKDIYDVFIEMLKNKKTLFKLPENITRHNFQNIDAKKRFYEAISKAVNNEEVIGEEQVSTEKENITEQEFIKQETTENIESIETEETQKLKEKINENKENIENLNKQINDLQKIIKDIHNTTNDLTVEEQNHFTEEYKKNINIKKELINKYTTENKKYQKELDTILSKENKEKDTAKAIAEQLYLQNQTPNKNTNIYRTTNFRNTKSPSGFVNHSGGAKGVDSYVAKKLQNYKIVTNHYMQEGNPIYNDNPTIQIANETLITYDPKLKKVAKYLNKPFPTKIPFVNYSLRCSMVQVENADTIYAISNITFNGEKFIVDGETGWTVTAGILDGKPIYVYNQTPLINKKGKVIFKQAWYKIDYETGKWKETETPTITQQHFAFIGTREKNFTQEGKKAIDDFIAKNYENKIIPQSESIGTEVNIPENMEIPQNTKIEQIQEEASDTYDDINTIEEQITNDIKNNSNKTNLMNISDDIWGEEANEDFEVTQDMLDNARDISHDEYFGELNNDINKLELSPELRYLVQNFTNKARDNIDPTMQIKKSFDLEANGAYIGSENVLLLGSSLKDTTRLHEFIHAVTIPAISSNWNQAKTYVSKIKQIRNYVQDNLDENPDLLRDLGLLDKDGYKNKTYADIFNTGNIEEFIAYFLSDAKKLNYLNNLSYKAVKKANKYQRKSLIGKVFNFIEYMFNGLLDLISKLNWRNHTPYNNLGNTLLDMTGKLSDYSNPTKAAMMSNTLYAQFSDLMNGSIKTLRHNFFPFLLNYNDYMKRQGYNEAQIRQKLKEASVEIGELLSEGKSKLNWLNPKLYVNPLNRTLFLQGLSMFLNSSSNKGAREIARMLHDLGFGSATQQDSQRKLNAVINANQQYSAVLEANADRTKRFIQDILQENLGDKYKQLELDSEHFVKPSDEEIQKDLYNRKQYTPLEQFKRDLGQFVFQLKLSRGLKNEHNDEIANENINTLLHTLFYKDSSETKEMIKQAQQRLYRSLNNLWSKSNFNDNIKAPPKDFLQFINNASKELAMSRIVGGSSSIGLNNVSDIFRQYILAKKDDKQIAELARILGMSQANDKYTIKEDTFEKVTNSIYNLINYHIADILKTEKHHSIEAINLGLENIKEKTGMTKGLTTEGQKLFTSMLVYHSTLDKVSENKLNFFADHNDPQIYHKINELNSLIKDGEDPERQAELRQEIFELRLKQFELQNDFESEDYRFDYSLDNHIPYTFNNQIDIKTLSPHMEAIDLQQLLQTKNVNNFEEGIQFLKDLGYKLIDKNGKSIEINPVNIELMQDEEQNGVLTFKYDGFNQYNDEGINPTYIGNSTEMTGNSLENAPIDDEAKKELLENAIKQANIGRKRLFDNSYKPDINEFLNSDKEYRLIGATGYHYPKQKNGGGFYYTSKPYTARTRLSALKYQTLTDINMNVDDLFGNLNKQIHKNSALTKVNEYLADAIIADNIELQENPLFEVKKKRMISLMDFNPKEDLKDSNDFEPIFSGEMYNILHQKLKVYNKNKADEDKIKGLYIDPVLIEQITGVRNKKFSNMVNSAPLRKIMNTISTGVTKLFNDEKQTMLIRNPRAVVANYASNFITAMGVGISISDIANDTPVITREIDIYKAQVSELFFKQQQLIELSGKTNLTEEEQELIDEIKDEVHTLANKIKENRVYYPMSQGIDTNIIDETLRERDDTDKFMSSIIEKPLSVLGKKEVFGRLASKVANEITLGQSSEYYIQMQRINKLGDLVPKIMIYEHYLKQGYSQENALEKANDYLINYNIPMTSKTFRTLDKTGLAFFMKWFIKTQKASYDQMYDYPFNSAISLAAKAIIGSSLVSPLVGENVMIKGFPTLFGNATNLSGFGRYGWLF